MTPTIEATEATFGPALPENPRIFAHWVGCSRELTEPPSGHYGIPVSALLCRYCKKAMFDPWDRDRYRCHRCRTQPYSYPALSANDGKVRRQRATGINGKTVFFQRADTRLRSREISAFEVGQQ